MNFHTNMLGALVHFETTRGDACEGLIVGAWLDNNGGIQLALVESTEGTTHYAAFSRVVFDIPEDAKPQPR